MEIFLATLGVCLIIWYLVGFAVRCTIIHRYPIADYAAKFGFKAAREAWLKLLHSPEHKRDDVYADLMKQMEESKC